MKHFNQLKGNFPLKFPLIVALLIFTLASPSSLLAQSITLQAESATLSGVAVKTDHVGYTGGGFADYQNLNNDFIEWKVELTASRFYTFQFRYAYGGAGARPLQISVNGNIIASVYPFFSTGNWDTWGVTTDIGSTLNAGVNTIRATAVGYSGPNIDKLTLVPDASSTSGLGTKLYPNPSSSILNVEMLQEVENAEIKIFNSRGLEVKRSLIPKGQKDISLNVTGLSPGLYSINISTGNVIEKKTFFIQ